MNKLNDYLKLVKKRREAQKTISLSMPSGMDWILKPVNIAQLSIAGKLPTSLYVRAIKKDAEPPTEEEMAEAGFRAMELTRDVMLNNLVFPRITLEPSPDSICIDEVAEKIDPEDFQRLLEWLMAGAQAGEKKI